MRAVYPVPVPGNQAQGNLLAKLLMNLRNVPEDEALAVRQLMAEHGIECYETPPSMFLISAGGIWLRDDEEFPRARELLDHYQAERARSARADFERQQQAGEAPTLWSHLAASPVRVIVYMVLSAGVLFLFATPVVQLFR